MFSPLKLRNAVSNAPPAIAPIGPIAFTNEAPCRAPWLGTTRP